MRVGGPLGGQGIISYHTAPLNVKHIPIHGSIAIYTKIPGAGQEVGTMACIVWEGNKPLILSNQHVLYPNSATVRPKVGDLVYQIGDSAPIGKLYKTIAEPNPWPAGTKTSGVGTYHDSALAEPLVDVSDEVNGIGKITGHKDPQVGMNIRFNGNKSGLRKGKITGVNKNYSNPVAGGKISIVKNVFTHSAGSDHGDSGSLIVSDDNKAVGLVYSGTGVGSEGTGCLASVIASKYGISFAKPSGAPTTSTPAPTPSPTTTPSTGDTGAPNLPDFIREKPFIVGVGIITIGLMIVGVAAGQR